MKKEDVLLAAIALAFLVMWLALISGVLLFYRERRARRKLETVDMARFHILDKEVESALKQLREMGEAKLAWQDRAQVAEAGLNECLWTMSRAYEHLTRYVHRCDGPSNDPWPDPYRARSIATAIKAILDETGFPHASKTDETPESGAQP